MAWVEEGAGIPGNGADRESKSDGITCAVALGSPDALLG